MAWSLREVHCVLALRISAPRTPIGSHLAKNSPSHEQVFAVKIKDDAPLFSPWHLPAYSPDLNPIEKAGAMLTPLLRSVKVRNREALDQAITELLPLLTAEDALAWFILPFAAVRKLGGITLAELSQLADSDPVKYFGIS